MRKLLFSFLIILISLNFSLAQYGSFIYDGLERTYLVHLPENNTNNEPLPLIIAMHGGVGNASNLQNQSQLSKKADKENFIVVYPEGVEGGILNIRTWNAGWCCGHASESNIDDVGFINALIDTLLNTHSIIENRIYATGMSNGGFMSYRLACELSDRIAAIAPVAASMTFNNCTPNRSVPIISFHSYQDENVPYLGGQGSGLSNHHNSPQDSVLDVWKYLNNCIDENDTVVNNSEYTFIKRLNCECNAEIHQYLTQDGGHSWPGGKSTISGDDVSSYIDANDLMWDFFKQYTLDCQPSGTSSSEKENIKLDIYPNPSFNTINLNFSKPINNYQVKVYNQIGRIVYQSRNKTKLNLKNLPKGFYHILVQSNKLLFSKRIVKVK